MAKEKILIAVKTYPTISEKYAELTCTAGFREDGSWIRLYPVPFRFLEQEKRYKKYQWIEADLAARRKQDPRPESYRVSDIDTIKILGEIGTARDWEDRRKLILGNNKVYTNLKELIGLAHQNKLSLAVYKPTEIIEFVAEAVDPEWPKEKIDKVFEHLRQENLFQDKDAEDFKFMPKLPYKFSYRFKDQDGTVRKLMIEDWEVGQLYLNSVKHYGADKAVAKVREMYFDNFANTKDLYFFLGTTYVHHVRKAKNPFVIIGAFYPPYSKQPSLF